jgi:predicted RNase H-like HicB family nuclease
VEFDVAQQYTAVIKQDGDWWIGWVEEVAGVNCQEPTREELIKTLQVTLTEAIEQNRSDAISLAENGYEELLIAV